jgi:1-acyl-sn-glycerol-3-phosphate acyltransferase
MLDNIPHRSPLDPEQIETLTQVCIDDLLNALGLSGLRRSRHPLEWLFRIPARRLARQIATYDQIVGGFGLRAGAEWALGLMTRGLEIEGRGSVPRHGPLLLVSNHPGLSDAVVLFAATPRLGMRVVAAEWPLLDTLPNTSRYLRTVRDSPSGRLGLIRAAARHLGGGGALLIFPAGRLEPDPAVMPGAVEALEQWSASVEMFARLVPELTVIPAVVSGVLSPAAYRNPLTCVRRRKEDRQWLTSNLQMLLPALRNVTPKVTFGPPIRATTEKAICSVVLSEVRHLMERHVGRRGW